MSLAKIAKALGLSVPTVSRALGGYDEVALATRERVRAEAERIGYRANKTARRLQSGRSEAIGLVLPTNPGQFDDPFFLRLIAGIGPRLAQADMDLIVTAAPPGPEELRAYQHLLNGRKVDGVLVARTRRHDERIAFLLDHRFPFVAHGRTQDPRPYAWVDTDGAAAMAQATERLIALGHRRIALLNALSSFNYAHDRETGWRRALRNADLPDTLSTESAPTEAEGEQAARHLLQQPNPPTALLCATDRLAAGAVRAAIGCGLVVGRDVSVIGFDNLPFASYIHPRLTTIEQPVEQSGTVMADMLLQILSGADPAGLNVLLPTRLVVRASDGKLPNQQETHLGESYAPAVSVRP